MASPDEENKDLGQELTSEMTQMHEELAKLETQHEDYLRRLAELSTLQEECCRQIKHLNYTTGQIREKAAKQTGGTANPAYQSIKATRVRLIELQRALPVSNNGVYLSTILGSNLNLSLLTKAERYKYKQEYETFKYTVTLLILAVCVVAWFSHFRVVDAIGNFLMVWYYCTLTIRESVLRVNGSRIKGWWVAHHYITCVLCGITLTWKDGECYQKFRPQFIIFAIYICLAQLMQTRYQRGCLRRLHSLGEGHDMDVTLEGFTSWQFKGLTFLLPLLVSAYLFQFYNAWALWRLSGECEGQWQVPWLAGLFFLIAAANLWTTLIVLVKKRRSNALRVQAASPRKNL